MRTRAVRSMVGPSTTGPAAPAASGASTGAARPLLIDSRRLARAVHLSVEAAGKGRYAVSGGREMHVVIVGPDPSCDCCDARIRGRACKHRLAVLLARRLPPPVLEGFRCLLPAVGASIPLTEVFS